MSNLFETLRAQGVTIPIDTEELLNSCKGDTLFNTTDELALAALGGEGKSTYEVR